MAGTVTGRRADKGGEGGRRRGARLLLPPPRLRRAGGEKLDAALKTFRVPASRGRHRPTWAAPTGGFTDCLLAAGHRAARTRSSSSRSLPRCRARAAGWRCARTRGSSCGNGQRAGHLSREISRGCGAGHRGPFVHRRSACSRRSPALIVGGIWSPWSSRSSRRVERGAARRRRPKRGCTRAFGTLAWRQSGAARDHGIAESPLTGPAGNWKSIHARGNCEDEQQAKRRGIRTVALVVNARKRGRRGCRADCAVPARARDASVADPRLPGSRGGGGRQRRRNRGSDLVA